VLVVPGGGTGHPGAEDASAQFLAAAKALAESGIEVRYVGPAGAVDAGVSAFFQPLGALAQTELATLMRHARLIVVNGGSTLLAGDCLRAACVAVPIAGDQRERIRRCVAAAWPWQAPLAAAEICGEGAGLVARRIFAGGVGRARAGSRLADGVEIALSALDRYIESA